MNRTLWTAAAIACATTVAMTAQTPSSTTSKAMDDKPVTVTGCLQDSSASAAGTTTSGGFVLANATMGSGSMSSGGSTATTTGTTTGTTGGTSTTTGSTSATTTPPPTGTAAGTTGTASGSSMSTARTYKLEGSDSDLKKHVGHRIEVTGTIDSQSSSETSTTTATPGTTSSAHTSSTDQRLKVSSVRMIAADCSSR